MKDSDIISDDALLVWGADLITDSLWQEYFEARQDRNRRIHAEMQKKHAERKKWKAIPLPRRK